MNLKKLVTVAFVASVGLGGLTACAESANPIATLTGGPEKMCGVVEDYSAKYEEKWGDPENMSMEELEQALSAESIQQAMDDNIQLYADMEKVAPKEIRDEVAAAKKEAEALAQVDTSDPMAVMDQEYSTDAMQQVSEYLKQHGCTAYDDLAQ
ncbi:hypothetical protein QP027_09625 [Corynebacterium breve]|uniref:Uncharacterized protein n=1 Tax=Corynebacterium breve TaxID=3049799 RepID=A0ABY8VE17_9CORY|nr:hypothetical protein [Corynebacterium breve]WIM67352.1 hypothetical protein QP027_09625 [Corynebacterium breve]